jgi:Outer membrane protein beta-barrel domain
MRTPLLLSLLGGIAAISLAAGAANADDALEGYVGAGVTKPKIDDVLGDGQNIDKTQWKAMLGVSQKWLGFEADYYRLGSITTTEEHTKANAVAGYGIFLVPISKLTLLGKVGFARWQMSGVVNTTDGFDEHGYAFAWGGGAQYKYSQYAVRFEYERFNVVSTQGAVVYALSLIYSFP